MKKKNTKNKPTKKAANLFLMPRIKPKPEKKLQNKFKINSTENKPALFVLKQMIAITLGKNAKNSQEIFVEDLPSPLGSFGSSLINLFPHIALQSAKPE